MQTSLLFCFIYFSFAYANLDEFHEWFSSSGGKFTHIRVKQFESNNRGITCLQHIAENDVVLDVPLNMVLHMSTTHADPQHKSLSQSFVTMNDDGLLAILLYEKYKPNSSYKEYIDTLPTQVRNALYFDSKEMDAFQNPELVSKMVEMQKNIEHSFPAFKKKFKSHSFVTFDITQDDLIWATTILDSRALRFNGKPHLIPFADMFNFMPHDIRRIGNSGQFFLKYHQLNETGIRILADRNCETDEQLFEDYGDSNDDIYLLHHGFVPESNPFRCIEFESLKLSTLKKDTRNVIKAMELNPKTPIRGCVNSKGYLGDHLFAVLITVAMNSDELAVCQQATTQNKGNWKVILEVCGYSRITAELKSYLDSSYKDISSLSPLASRSLEVIQKWLPKASPFKFIGSPEEDLQLLEASPEMSLPIQYRINFKRLFLEVCGLYKAPCKIKSLKRKAVSNFYNFEDNSSMHLKDQLYFFNKWFNSNKPSSNSIEAVEDPDYRIGVRALRDIKENSTYLGVPDAVIMDRFKAEKDPMLAVLFSKIKAKRGDVDAFHKLLFYLMYHRFMLGPKSEFWPYLRTLPPYAAMDVPPLWSNESIIERLSPSVLSRVILQENADTRKTFEQIIQLDEILDFFPSKLFTFDYYMWAKTILNSRSIWWDGERHLVPMLDFINHGEGSDPQKVHSTTLDSSKRFAITNASWAFKKGDQVFENYGQANHVYLAYHGFSMKLNFHDCVQFDLQLTPEEADALDWSNDMVLKIAQRIYLRDKSSVFTTCLSPMGIEQNAWLFLSLKMNSYSELVKRNQLGRPNVPGLLFILERINERVVKYEGYPGLHYASSQFIFAEEALLGTLTQRIKRTLAQMDEAYDREEQKAAKQSKKKSSDEL